MALAVVVTVAVAVAVAMALAVAVAVAVAVAMAGGGCVSATRLLAPTPPDNVSNLPTTQPHSHLTSFTNPAHSCLWVAWADLTTPPSAQLFLGGLGWPAR